jgi:hypothetical protein
VLVQDNCTVCTKHTMGSTHPMVLLGDEAQVEANSFCLVMVLILPQDRCTVCAERTIGSEIDLDASGGTPR